MENSNTKRNEDIDCEMRPSGMLVQKRENKADHSRQNMITINVSHGSSTLQLSVPVNSTFGDLKRALVQKSGLEPVEQKIMFRGQAKEDDEHLQMAGVKDQSKILLFEDPVGKVKRLEEAKKMEEISRSCEAVATVRAEVDKLLERVAAIEMDVKNGNKVPDIQFLESSELLMRELLKLDNIQAEGEARLQRKAEVRRVQGIVDSLDTLKEKNCNPFNSSNSVTITTKWETFDSGMGSLNAPPPRPTATQVTENWEEFD